MFKWSEGSLADAMVDKTLSLTHLELQALCVTLETFAGDIRGLKIVCLCDNEGVVRGFAKRYFKNGKTEQLLLNLFTFLASNDIEIIPRYIKSTENVLADPLSRGDLLKFRSNVVSLGLDVDLMVEKPPPQLVFQI